MAILNIIIGLLLGFGAVQELIIPGIGGRQLQPAIVGSVGAVASGLLIAAGIATFRRWRSVDVLTVAAGVSLIALHTYGALPPHRNVGILAFLVGTGYGLVLLAVHISRRRRHFSGGA
jgi:hypothetical protein